ncbi:hypothetical protein EG68_01717 [Paragonimus skrjabini miyazakii]|uniref:Uncharacterized protein n=1 Tax=Paragonimus skrjabini miyazakii TaxID=59628 RepID=A0A8S9Z0W2_9TREM|nr:hypothetical protein EG68_01717 [Paragonimus skrjabini miyazakii]
MHLGYGRYDYSTQSCLRADGRMFAKAEIDVILNRLQPPLANDGLLSSAAQVTLKQKHPAEATAEIIEKLASCDFKKCPVESSRGRHPLGYNRYDYGPSVNFQQYEARKVTKTELENIIDRLTTYDVGDKIALQRITPSKFVREVFFDTWKQRVLINLLPITNTTLLIQLSTVILNKTGFDIPGALCGFPVVNCDTLIPENP